MPDLSNPYAVDENAAPGGKKPHFSGYPNSIDPIKAQRQRIDDLTAELAAAKSLLPHWRPISEIGLAKRVHTEDTFLVYRTKEGQTHCSGVRPLSERDRRRLTHFLHPDQLLALPVDPEIDPDVEFDRWYNSAPLSDRVEAAKVGWKAVIAKKDIESVHATTP